MYLSKRNSIFFLSKGCQQREPPTRSKTANGQRTRQEHQRDSKRTKTEHGKRFFLFFLRTLVEMKASSCDKEEVASATKKIVNSRPLDSSCDEIFLVSCKTLLSPFLVA